MSSMNTWTDGRDLDGKKIQEGGVICPRDENTVNSTSKEGK